jgi:hypothetical protein
VSKPQPNVVRNDAPSASLTNNATQNHFVSQFRTCFLLGFVFSRTSFRKTDDATRNDLWTRTKNPRCAPAPGWKGDPKKWGYLDRVRVVLLAVSLVVTSSAGLHVKPGTLEGRGNRKAVPDCGACLFIPIGHPVTLWYS